MSQFKRGISQQFVDRLNAEYKAGGWWRAIADDRELFVAIRKDYLNVYLNGNSLLKLWQEGNQLVGETHYKYLLAPETARPYVKVVGGKALIDEAAALFTSDLSDLAALKRAAKAYSGDEKKGVHQIAMSNPNVIDVEIAFGSENEDIGKKPRSVSTSLHCDRDRLGWKWFFTKPNSSPIKSCVPRPRMFPFSNNYAVTEPSSVTSKQP